jgi:hypothetical protein
MNGEKTMYFIFGLVDPRTASMIHVGYTIDAKPQLKVLPEMVADRIREMALAAPQLIILQTVESHPCAEWVKWSKRFRRDLLSKDWEKYEAIAGTFTNSKRARRLLGEDITSDAETQANFHAFDRKNPEVFDEMLRRAHAFSDEGCEICGVDLIVCEIRYSSTETNRVDGFKFSNFLKPFYARKLQMIDPLLCGLFVVHPSVADDLVLTDGRTWRDFASEHSDSIRFEGSNGTEEDAQWTY